MLKTIFLVLYSSISLQSFSQSQTEGGSETASWLRKSQHQKTAAWLLLSGGALMASSGYVLFVYEGLQGDGVKSPKATIDAVICIGGVAAMVSSIPLFSAAARNRKIATSLTASFKMEKSISPLPASIVKTSFPALSFKIRL